MEGKGEDISFNKIYKESYSQVATIREVFLWKWEREMEKTRHSHKLKLGKLRKKINI